MKKVENTNSAWVCASPGDNTVTQSIQSLGPDDLKIVYQPIVDLESGALFANEALVRCQLQQFSTPPELFKQAVKENSCGLLGRMIRNIIFEDDLHSRLFVNIHPIELSSSWLVRPDDPICFSREEVYLEVTESATLQYYELCVSVLREVCFRTGAHLVIDDLGAGYSNLERLADLQPSIVKLDAVMAKKLDTNKRKRILVEHLVKLCVALGAKVVIEGIETLDELNAARDAGAHYAQGFFLGRPSFPAPGINWPI
jgi:EAL domain-containing protein (putative c-di-GMP-specific phosphodiesterase class I)